MAETPQQRAERLNTGNKFSGRSYSVLNGRVVQRQDGYNVRGQSDWQELISGETVGPYVKPAQPKPATQTGNPFGQNFAPFEIPDNAPIRALIGQKTDAQRNAAPQNANPFAPNFQPFFIPNSAPIRQVIGPRPSKSGGYYSPGGNPDASGQGQTQQNPGMGPYQGITPPPAPSAPPAPSGRDTSAPVDPNGAGGKGTSMSYAGFMKDIGTPQKIEVRDTYASENLPGTASYGASFALNSGENQRSFGADAAIAQAVDGRIVPKVTLNAQNLGTMASMAENQRQLTPGEGSFSSNPEKLGVMDTSIPKSKGSSEADNLARRAAFLDAGDSQQGLRAVEGLQGMMTQGGKNFVRDSSAEGGLKEIGQDEYRARRRGGIISAAKGKASARTAQATTAASEAPQNVENPAVIGEDGKIEIIDNTTALQGVQAGFTSGRKVDNRLRR